MTHSGKRRGLQLLCLAVAGCWCVTNVGAQWNDLNLKPFVMDHRAGGSSPADLSFLEDAPAGKDGFIRVQDGHLATANGKRIRFWGVHITDWSPGSVILPPKEDAPMWAATLARFGVNIVRLHFLDLPSPRGLIDASRNDTQGFDAQQLDRLDFWVSELKKRGIYVDLNLNVGRSYKAGDGVQDYDKIQWAKGLTLFDPRIIELEKDYARQILTHENPYTKTEYRNEPAVAIVEIVNENGIGIGFHAPTSFYQSELADQYNAWLQKHRTPAEISRLRDVAGVSADAAVPLLTGTQITSVPENRFRTEMSFYMDTESHFYQEMDNYLKSTLGVKVPIIGTADHGHTNTGYPMVTSLSHMDILDGHVYWEHPGSREPKNMPMVNDPEHSTVVQLSRTAFAGKPYTVSETNHPFPNDWLSEGIPIIAAYGSFQDWDAIITYTFEPKLSPDWKPYIGDAFDISLDPIRMTEFATGALMFRRGDVRPAVKTIERTYSRAQVMDSRRLGVADWPYFTPNFPPFLPLEHASRVGSLDGPPTENFVASNTDPIVSDTHQLAWYTTPEQIGVVTVETDRTEALIGFLGANSKVLKTLSADVKNIFATIVLSSMDSKPLAQSDKMLLTAGSRVTNTGMKWNDFGTALTDQGGSPTLIEPVSGTITLRNLQTATAVTATALDGAGHALGEPIPGKRTPGGWTLAIGDPVTTWYVITVMGH